MSEVCCIRSPPPASDSMPLVGLERRRLPMTGGIEINPSVMLGKPVVRNTRIPVELLLRKLAEGAKIPELLDAYPRLTEEDVRACLEYAADTIAHEGIYSLSAE